MTTDGIMAVTKGTAAASLSDNRPSRHQTTGKPSFPKEEPIDRYERPGDLAHSPTGGLVQLATKAFSSSHQGGNHESDPLTLKQQQRQPPRPSSAFASDEAMSSSSAKLARDHSPDYHLYSNDLGERSSAHHYDTARGPFAAYEQAYQPYPSGNGPNADAAYAFHPPAQHRRAEDDIRLARGSASQPLHSHDQRHHYPALSPQPHHSSRYSRDSTHARTLIHGSPEHGFDGHGGLERMQGQGLDDGRDMTRTYDGRYDAESQHRMRRRRGDYETISEPQSTSLAAAAAGAVGAGTVPLRREGQRGIRSSVSESDLASVELKQERERRLGGGSLGKDG
ncbi:hypothetical protein BGZ97_003503 [Linnemannia gamsii]|uniref:Uncharacterized protein n=1 Tax=Linnemannia gamsii TaxID=64522 RepID=A0A9P6UGH8_9FUNG|nr:hypothetical protein BGZ97_003503 [Linnemannia gamsii]